MTPLKAIRARCLDCAAGELATVRRCEMPDCPLHRLRMGKGSKRAGGCLRPIRLYCLWCMNGQSAEVRQCPSENRCELYPYRMGRRPETGARPRKSTRTGHIGEGIPWGVLPTRGRRSIPPARTFRDKAMNPNRDGLTNLARP